MLGHFITNSSGHPAPQVQTPVVKNCLLPKLCREDVDGDEEKSDREFGSEN
jgi:hypothetical protein